ncbi:MAG: GntR family transcriptional regulator [Rhodospirillales bacterium]
MGQLTIRSAEYVREQLEHDIVTGEFADGERLDETRLAARFEVSRTPLREALHLLTASGLVEMIPRRGTFVRQPSVIEMIEMFEVMAELEALCGRLVVRRASSEDVKEISDAAEACEEALLNNDPDAYYRENETFHMLLYRHSGNGFLAKEAARLHKRLQAFRRIQLRARGRMEQSMAEHRAVVAAIEAADEERTALAIHAHVSVQGAKFNDLMASYKSSGMHKAS